MHNMYKDPVFIDTLIIPCELELELDHSQDQKGLKLSQVGVGDMPAADMQVVDMKVEEILPVHMLAFPGTGIAFLM